MLVTGREDFESAGRRLAAARQAGAAVLGFGALLTLYGAVMMQFVARRY